MDYDEMSPDGAVYRSHMRAMTEARQVAERAKAVRSRDPAVRVAIEQTYKQELARIDGEHRAWLREHGGTDDRKPARQRAQPADYVAPE